MREGAARGDDRQALTPDAPYREFASPRQHFIAAEIPANDEDTRLLLAAACNADLAVVLVDARKGLLPLTRRHTFLVHLLGVRKVVLAVDKMDLAGCEQAAFDRLADDFRRLAEALRL
jgi:bifunctional enzyme CysN/CysC